MKTRTAIVCLVCVAALAIAVGTWSRWPLSAASLRAFPSDRLARLAVAAERRQAEPAIAELRRRGPVGLDAVLAEHGTAIAQGFGEPRSAPGDDRPWRRMRAAADAVAAQHDAWSTGLFWYTDLDAALQAAAASGKPVLSLRLLGRLDEELSCANSRAFRTVLYPDPEVNREMREHFILHWQSVRPVPKLTVDFGDGKKLVTTITGNSVHYVLAPDGRPVDAITGLNGPLSFAASLREAADAAATWSALAGEERQAFLACHHSERLAALDRELAVDLAALGLPPVSTSTPPRIARGGVQFTSWPEAVKHRVELPLLRALVPGVRGLQTTIDDSVWSEIARLHPENSVLRPGTRAVVRAKRLAGSGADKEADVEPLFGRLQRSLAEETARNEQVYHRRIHEWFAAGAVGSDTDELDERVYRELFLSPANDGWLGLVPPDAWNGLEGGGVVSGEGRS